MKHLQTSKAPNIFNMEKILIISERSWDRHIWQHWVEHWSKINSQQSIHQTSVNLRVDELLNGSTKHRYGCNSVTASMFIYILLRCPWARQRSLPLLRVQLSDTQVECNRTTSRWWFSCCSTLDWCCWILHVTCVLYCVSMSVFKTSWLSGTSQHAYHQCFNVLSSINTNRTNAVQKMFGSVILKLKTIPCIKIQALCVLWNPVGR